MKIPLTPLNEQERLRSLSSYGIVDTLPEDDYDNLTKIASQICGTKISLVSIIDAKRQWFKSQHGIAATETPRQFAFCAHAINNPEEVLIVNDARHDDRFHDNPYVTGDPYVIFYAGVPLVNEEGYPLGTLCVIDQTPKDLSKDQIDSLKALSRQVMNLMELRKKKRLLEKSLESLQQRNTELEQFAYIAAHDIKSPLNNISTLASLFTTKFKEKIGTEGEQLMKTLRICVDTLKNMVDGLLEYSKSIRNIEEEQSIIDLNNLNSDLQNLFTTNDQNRIIIKSELSEINTNKAALEQILINLVSNALKYNDKDSALIEIGISQKNDFYEFYVQDNGPGIPATEHERIFQLFETNAQKDRFGQKGNGIGLATVKKVVQAMEGSIKIDSVAGSGTKFVFSFRR